MDDPGKTYEELLAENAKLRKGLETIRKGLSAQQLFEKDVAEFAERQNDLRDQMEEFLERNDKFRVDFTEYTRERDKLRLQEDRVKEMETKLREKEEYLRKRERDLRDLEHQLVETVTQNETEIQSQANLNRKKKYFWKA
jgi:phosphoenolpyruvate-protein kinase (PTS system EI component)